MKKLALCAILLLVSPAFATIAQQRNNFNWSCSGTTSNPPPPATTGTIACTANFTTTGATDLIAVWTTWQSTATLTAQVTDFFGTYASAVGPTLQSASSTPISAQIFYLKNIGGGADSVQVTLTGPKNQPVPAFGMVIVEYSGLDQSAPLDSVSEAMSNTASTAFDSGTVSPANANLLLFGAGATDYTAALPTAGSGFTTIQSNGGSITEQTPTL